MNVPPVAKIANLAAFLLKYPAQNPKTPPTVNSEATGMIADVNLST